jgi:hypothetical protein
VSGSDRAEMQRLLAAELARRGWDYDLTTVPAILDEVEHAGTANPERLAGRVSSEYLNRVGASRADVADAIEQAIGGRTLTPPPAAPGGVTIDQRNSINIGAGAQITGGNINTGSQISIRNDSPREDVLDALATLVTAGLGGEWSTEEADDLSRVLAGRDDVNGDDIQQRTINAATKSGADHAQIKALLTQVGTSTAVGVLTPAITAGLNHLL